jgi:hypothetical protein
MSNLTSLILAIAILVTQHFLSRREQPYWGAILPISYIGFLVYGDMTGLIDFSDNRRLLYFIGVIGTLILLQIWISGRKELSNKRKKELEKIEAHNL